MTNTSTNAQHPASPATPNRVWTKPVVDILALASAEHGFAHVNDRLNSHKSG